MNLIAPPFGTDAPDCSLDILDNNLYFITFHTSTRAAADAFVANLGWVYARSVETATPFDCLIDASHATVSITYLMRGVRSVVAKFPVRPSNKIAIVMNHDYVVLVEYFLKLLPSPNPVHFFQTKEAALEWLRA
ncbi:MAG: hypothetical protein KF716_18655 [Anaerolineae bacterium]|nr:hypothetical protein [Anaerolineae bacterium]